jgi:hypothetical protein
MRDRLHKVWCACIMSRGAYALETHENGALRLLFPAGMKLPQWVTDRILEAIP